MQDIRALAAMVAQHRADADLDVMAHAAIRSYAVDLLVNLAQAIRPTTPDEQAAVTWLAQAIIKVAAQIPEAKRSL